MATINYEYQEDKVLYDSGSVEEFILNKYKNNEEVSLEDEGCFYSYVEARENIVNWYPFKENGTILELGAGIGSVTGALCKKAKKVVSCEYSRRRAESLYYRHKDKDNLEVIIGNFQKIKFFEKFDYIVLIGVFEYAKRFYDTKNPFEDFLSDIKKLLKPEGVVLIAIENRYGIKYWAGATEDHFGEKYIGMIGYENLDIVTFGKIELIKLFNDSGFKHYKFYYPFPDYKMPYLIHTDNRLPLFTEIPNYKMYNHGEQLYNFDYRKILPGIIENRQYDFFANSYLIELALISDVISDVIFVKTFWARTQKYNINTIIKANGRIIKIPKNKESNSHLLRMIQTHKKIENYNIKVSKIKKIGKEFEIENIDGINLSEYLYYLAVQKNKKEIIKELNNYYRFIMSISKKEKINKFAIPVEKKYFMNKSINILKINLIDLNMSNIIKSKSDYYIIDQEWTSEFSIPTNYILYFSVLLLYNSIQNLESIITKEEVYGLFDINNSEKKIYSKMSEFFAKKEQKSIDENLNRLFEKENQLKFLDKAYENTCLYNMKLEKEFEEEKHNLEEKINYTNLKYKEEINTINMKNEEEKHSLEQKIKTIVQQNQEEIEKNKQILDSRRWKFIQKVLKPIDKIKGR